MTEKELRDKHEHEMLKNNIRLFILLFGMIFFTWLGIEVIGLDFRIYVPILTFVWFFSHIAEAFVIQHYMEKNVPDWLQKLQLK